MSPRNQLPIGKPMIPKCPHCDKGLFVITHSIRLQELVALHPGGGVDVGEIKDQFDDGTVETLIRCEDCDEEWSTYAFQELTKPKLKTFIVHKPCMHVKTSQVKIYATDEADARVKVLRGEGEYLGKLGPIDATNTPIIYYGAEELAIRWPPAKWVIEEVAATCPHILKKWGQVETYTVSCIKAPDHASPHDDGEGNTW